jgi:hypothetical protein
VVLVVELVPAIESDSKLFNKVLKPLVAKYIPIAPALTTPIDIDDDDDDALPDKSFDNVCE